MTRKVGTSGYKLRLHLRMQTHTHMTYVYEDTEDAHAVAPRAFQSDGEPRFSGCSRGHDRGF